MDKIFFQQGPELNNQYLADPFLKDYLSQHLKPESFTSVDADLKRFGDRTVGDLLKMSLEAENTKPSLVSFDPWGVRIDQIQVSHGWNELNDVAATEGIVATGYERKYLDQSRLVQFAKLYLFHPSSAFFSCPLAMTDGAARAIELYGDENLKQRAYQNIISRDPKKFWVSGQWMTERSGGSDVSESETVAKHIEGDNFKLYGTKWFTSATTSQMAMTLARIEGDAPGSKGLSLFYLELRDSQGKLQNIEVHRLKDKLGTDALPTAELTLNGTPAKLVGGKGHGVRKISSLFNITRLYNSICALAAQRRALALAIDYSKKRVAFGKPIAELPLHIETMAQLNTEFAANFYLTFHAAELLGKDETNTANADEKAALRLLTPIAKLFTGKYALSITSEVVEVFGGAGYVEDTGLPRLLRDAQVFSIWEGTTNVLSLDVLRAIEKEGAFSALVNLAKIKIKGIDSSVFSSELTMVEQAFKNCEAYLLAAAKEGPEFAQAGARSFSFYLAKSYSAVLLMESAKNNKKLIEISKRWCESGFGKIIFPNKQYRDVSKNLSSL